MKRRTAAGLAASVLLGWMTSMACRADVIHQGARLTFQAGAFCNDPKDGKKLALDTYDGEIGIHVQPYKFVHLGDMASAAPDVAIGIIIQFKSFVAGEELTLQQNRLEDHSPPDRWAHVLARDGRLWFGTTPDPGKGLPTGHYQLSILRGQNEIFLYEFQVVPRGRMPELKRVCRSAG